MNLDKLKIALIINSKRKIKQFPQIKDVKFAYQVLYLQHSVVIIIMFLTSATLLYFIFCCFVDIGMNMNNLHEISKYFSCYCSSL